MTYQRMFIATVTVDTGVSQQTFIGVSHFEAGASTHLAESLESHGFSGAQIGRILDRTRVSEMKRGQLGCTIVLLGTLSQPFGRRV